MKTMEVLIVDNDPDMADVATGDTVWRATLSDENVERILQGVHGGTPRQVYALSKDGKFLRWNYDAWEELPELTFK